MKAAEKDMHSGPPQFSHADMYNKSANMWSGFGKAAMGLIGAFTNKDFQAGLLTSLTAGAVPIAAAISSPGLIGTTATGITNPATAQKVGDFITGLVDPNPSPASPGGLAGLAVKEGVKSLTE